MTFGYQCFRLIGTETTGQQLNQAFRAGCGIDLFWRFVPFFRYLASKHWFQVHSELLNCTCKIGGWFLAFLLFGLPLLNCALQAQAMTAAEKECCKKMAGQCGRAGMAQSHSCCPPNGSVDDRPILKAVPHVPTHFTLSVAHVVPQAELVASVAASLPLCDSVVHGPPGETPPNGIVLRI